MTNPSSLPEWIEGLDRYDHEDCRIALSIACDILSNIQHGNYLNNDLRVIAKEGLRRIRELGGEE